LGAEHGDIGLHRFPDGETLVRIDDVCAGKSVVLVCGGHNPNAGALPLYFAADAARAMRAANVGLVAPYLAYMRQDSAFHPGEAVSARTYGRFLSGKFDWISTVDPHLHRLKSLDEVFSIPSFRVSSMPAVSEWIAANVTNPVIVGPDAESTQWASSVAARLAVPWTVLQKTRTGDRDVSLSFPDPEIIRGRSPVIVDDIASSGHTLIEVAKRLRSLTTGPVTCVVVHALLEPGAEMAIRAAGVASLVSTNTVTHATNAIDVVPLLAEQVRMALRGNPG
jgi:ribose-phosphate pyrophosphokinase